jgi:hypothetical protein
MLRGFEAAKSFDPQAVAAALEANGGAFSTVKGPAKWREDHAAVYDNAAFLVKGKGADRRDEWDLFTVEGALGGDAVMPKLSDLGY